MSERLVIPVALWGDKAPTHNIYCLYMLNNEKNLITGGKNGCICVWDVAYSPTITITPRYMIYGHTSSVTCIADGDYLNKDTIVTSSDNGEMCLWNINDGHCLLNKRTQNTHTYMQSFKVSSKECRLFCIGHYAEILVIEPSTFNTQYRLSSKDKPDWITSIHILQPPQLNNIVIIGLSITGVVRIWTITDCTSTSLSPIYDNDSKALNCNNSVQIISNPESMRLLFIVCPQQWSIFDATDFLRLCTVDANENDNWSGGNFITRDQVLVWSHEGHAYLYNITTKRGVDSRLPSATKLKVVLKSKTDTRFLYHPKMLLSSNSNGKFLIRGDSSGTLTVWSANFQPSTRGDVTENYPIYTNSLDKTWKSSKQFIADNDIIQDKLTITSCLYLPAICRIAIAKSDCSITILTAIRFAIDNLMSSMTQSGVDTLLTIPQAHETRISCLFYPNSSNSRYDQSYLLSGGADFSACIWNLNNGQLIHRFCVHAGSIEKFISTPVECSERLATSVCCVASDHSVSILNLKERKCTMIASRQLFPIVIVKWKPTEDLMVVGCVDGSAYAWKTETGLLAKVLQASAAEEILASCDESIIVKEEQTNPAVELFKGLKQGNLSAIKNAAAKSIHQLATTNSQAKVMLTNSRSHPLTVQALQTNSNCSNGFVMLFDIESIIEYLLHDQNLVVEPFIILLSILYSWGLEEEVSQISQKYSEFRERLSPSCIGLISSNFSMSLLLPSFTRKICKEDRRNTFFSLNTSLTRLTGQCLSHLLFVPSSPSLPLYTSLRHTAVEMIGRGFTFWEPYLDVAKVLLGLLDLSSEPAGKGNSEATLSSKKSSQEALSLIATARPSVFITTLAREIAKFYNKQQSANFRSNQGLQIQPILVNAKAEILRNIELLINQIPLEVANLMTEVIDITLHCLDYSLLENRGLGEAFPALTKFYMVSYCPSTRRIAVGTVTGNLALYELRAQSRPQIISAHNSSVAACSFSTDGKYLASYSAGDNKLCFWLTTVSGLFGLGNIKTKCVGTIETPPVSADLIKNPSDLLRVAKLIWFADKRVVLMLIDDRELCYQVA